MQHGDSIEAVKRDVRIYLGVFIALLVLTFITVEVSVLHLPVGFAVVMGLLIATVKGSLVALIFMHLNHPNKWVIGLIVVTFIFFAACLLLPVLQHLNEGWMHGA